MTRSPAAASLLFAVFALALPAAAQADAAAAPSATGVAGDAIATVEPAAADKPKPDPFPLHGSASLTQQLGSATFVMTPYNPTFGSSLTLAPYATLTKDWTLSLQQVIGIEWTRSEGTTYANQLELSDLNARVSYSGLKWEDLGLSLSLNAGYNLPISLASRNQGSLGATSLGSRLGWSDKPTGFSAYGSGGVGYNPVIHELAGRVNNAKPVPYNDRALGPTTPVTCNLRPGEANSACLSGVWPSGFSWRVGIGGGYTPPVLDSKLSFSVDLGYSQAISSYIAPTDGTTVGSDGTEYQNADLVGEHAVGIAPRQGTSGNIGASYQVNDWFVATLGAQSGQPFLNARGDGIRFPFWDFTSTANNFSSIYLDTNFSF
jgi:hypothetical protein